VYGNEKEVSILQRKNNEGAKTNERTSQLPFQELGSIITHHLKSNHTTHSKHQKEERSKTRKERGQPIDGEKLLLFEGREVELDADKQNSGLFFTAHHRGHWKGGASHEIWQSHYDCTFRL